MKQTMLTMLIAISINCFAQVDYYSTNGNNRLAKSELDIKISEIKAKFEKLMKKELVVGVDIKKTIKKNDSIIHFTSFSIKDKLSAKEPLFAYLNQKLPEISITELSGKDFSFSKLNNKPTLINFWFTACKPCIDEIPILNKIHDEYKDKFNFVAITFDSKDEVEKFLNKHEFKFKQIVNAKVFTDTLSLNAFPVNVFLDSKGKVKYSTNGIPYIQDSNGKTEISDGKEFIKILKKLS